MHAARRRLAAGRDGGLGRWPHLSGRRHPADAAGDRAIDRRAVGTASAATSAALPPSAADALLAPQLAAHAFSAGDVGEYERLMALGARANLAENFAAAEIAYRAALALQQQAARPRQSRYRHRADASRVAGLRPGPLRRGRCVVQAGGRAGAACQRQGGGGAPAALPGAARTEPGAQRAGPDAAAITPRAGMPHWCRATACTADAQLAAGGAASASDTRHPARPGTDARSDRAVGADRPDRGAPLSCDRAAPARPADRKRGGDRFGADVWHVRTS